MSDMWALVIVLNCTKAAHLQISTWSAFSELNWVTLHLLLYQWQALSHGSGTKCPAHFLWLLDLMCQVISKSIHELRHVLCKVKHRLCSTQFFFSTPHPLRMNMPLRFLFFFSFMMNLLYTFESTFFGVVNVIARCLLLQRIRSQL